MEIPPDQLAEIDSALEDLILQASARPGSFADLPFEPGDEIDCGVTSPSELLALRAIERWIDGEPVPPLPPAAARYLYVYAMCARGWVGHLRGMPRPNTHPESLVPSFLRWLLLTVFADTTQVALDEMRTDLRSCLSDPSRDAPGS